MPWTDIFPVLTEEQVDEFHEEASLPEKAELEEWYGIDRIINPRPEATEIVSVSLFWKNVRAGDPELPTPTRERLQNAVELGLAERFNPWDHYVLPLLDLTPGILEANPEVSVRVYLAQDLEFLVDELAAAGSEVYLMKSSSINFAPGGLWRFLPFSEEGKLITVTDTDRLNELESDLVRSRAMKQTGVGAWRVPVPNDLTGDHKVCYLPFMGCQFGIVGGQIDVRELLDAFTWQCQRGQVEPYVLYPNCGPLPIQSHKWPSYGFDEFFMTVAAYPRLAQEGMLTFVPGSASSQLLTLDVEYCTWGNDASEIIYFPAGSCCGQAPTEELHVVEEELPEVELEEEIFQIPPPELGPEAKVAFLFLTQGELNQPELWKTYLDSAGEAVSCFTHCKTPEDLTEDSWLKETLIEAQAETEWASISLVHATLALLEAGLEDSDATHFVLISESCVPVRPFSDLARSLQLDPRSRMSVRSWQDERKTNVLRAQRLEQLDGIRKEIAHFQSQWMALSRKDAESIIANDLTESFANCFAPDEAYFATNLAVQGRPPLQAVANRPVTWVDWTSKERHPASFHEVSSELASAISESGCFFARKFSRYSNIADYGLHLERP
ncbi:MAG: beta-1,6-N-acetylglucosaminyltransferase [Akkermansiaceae bacterium]